MARSTNDDKSRSFVRGFLFPAIFALLLKVYLQTLLPYGRAQYNTIHPQFSPLDQDLNNLSAESDIFKKIYERVPDGAEPLLKGPETIIFDHEGSMYVFNEDANLLKLSNAVENPGTGLIEVDATVITTVVARPLGAKFVPNTMLLYFAVPVIGLCRIDLEKSNPTIEIVVSRIQLQDGTWSQLNYADDVDIGPQSGHVYFTDATDMAPRHEAGWDETYTSVQDLLRAKPSGRVFRYDPLTDKVDVLATGIWFANGIAVDKDETFIMISETFLARALKYNLKDGKIEVITGKLPGVVDGADCSHSTMLCYAPIPSPSPFVFKVLFSKFLPRTLEAWFRTFLMLLPPSLSPKPVKYGGVVEIYPGGVGNDDGPHITRVFQDLHGQNINFITGVTEHEGKLYLGSLYNNFIGVIDL